MVNDSGPDGGVPILGARPRKGVVQPVALVRRLDERALMDLDERGTPAAAMYVSANELVDEIVAAIEASQFAGGIGVPLAALVEAIRDRRALDVESAAHFEAEGVDAIALAAYLGEAREVNERIDAALEPFAWLRTD